MCARVYCVCVMCMQCRHMQKSSVCNHCASYRPYVLYNEDKENNEWLDGVCLCVATHMYVSNVCVCVPGVYLIMIQFYRGVT